MNRIRPVLLSRVAGTGQQVSLSAVNQWMGDLRDIPYGYHMEWKTPTEVQKGGPSDCKGKAVALYEKMQAGGAKNVRLVIGKRAPTSRMTHAWLVWETDHGTYLLDPTFNWNACRTEQLSDQSYVPLYATRAYEFRASSALFSEQLCWSCAPTVRLLVLSASLTIEILCGWGSAVVVFWRTGSVRNPDLGRM